MANEQCRVYSARDLCKTARPRGLQGAVSKDSIRNHMEGAWKRTREDPPLKNLRFAVEIICLVTWRAQTETHEIRGSLGFSEHMPYSHSETEKKQGVIEEGASASTSIQEIVACKA